MFNKKVCTFIITILLLFTATELFALLGDVNNDNTVDIIDALMTAQWYVGLEPPGFINENADFDCNTEVDIVDALKIAQCYVGAIYCPTQCVTGIWGQTLYGESLFVR